VPIGLWGYETRSILIISQLPVDRGYEIIGVFLLANASGARQSVQIFPSACFGVASALLPPRSGAFWLGPINHRLRTSAWRMACDASTSMMTPNFTSIR
jgi:hypothetical protein